MKSKQNLIDECFTALLKLKAKQGKCAEESDSVRTVCLPPPQQRLQSGVTCEIAGYGKEKHGEEKSSVRWTYRPKVCGHPKNTPICDSWAQTKEKNSRGKARES